MNSCFAYVRVSTAKQGSQGVSLQEQRSAIEAYAARNAIDIVEWFEEQETAAKRGRPVFSRMMKRLEATEAAGVIIHKIDRGARNLRDWADLGDLIDKGVKVHFATESLDLASRGGRLSADIQAVVAADYIRNLREETRKGFYGRLKQGFYPLAAPLGYLDNGKAKPKTIDPVKGPLVKRAFELYATGTYTLHSLRRELPIIGLTNKADKPLTINGLSRLLNNPFYTGVIRLKNGQTFRGVHEPLIARGLFNDVAEILEGRTPKRGFKHQFLFRQMIVCAGCGYKAIGERQKGHVYYRCHACRGSCVREETIDAAIRHSLGRIAPAPAGLDALIDVCNQLMADTRQLAANHRRTQAARLEYARGKLARLTDAMVDGLIERQAFEQRRVALAVEIDEIERQDGADPAAPVRKVIEYLERAKTAQTQYEIGTPSEKRDILKSVTSNLILDRKNVQIRLPKSFLCIAAYTRSRKCDPNSGTARTELLNGLLHIVQTDSEQTSKRPAIPEEPNLPDEFRAAA